MEAPNQTLVVVSWGWSEGGGGGWEQPLRKAGGRPSLQPVSLPSHYFLVSRYFWYARICVCVCVCVCVCIGVSKCLSLSISGSVPLALLVAVFLTLSAQEG